MATPTGYVPLRYLERIAICLEAGLTEAEALVVARQELLRGGLYVPG